MINVSDYDKSLHRHDKNRRMCHCESKIYSQQSLVYATRTKIELKLLLVSKKLYNIKTKTKLNFRTKIGLVTTGAIRRAKLQSNHHHPTNQHPVFLQTGCPSCRPINIVRALKEKYHIPKTCWPKAHLRVFQLCLWPLKKKKKISHRQWGLLHGSSCPFLALGAGEG